MRQNIAMDISAGSDYAVRALLCLTDTYLEDPTTLMASADIAAEQQIPVKFLEAILSELKHAGLVDSKRGAHGGYHLGKHPREISVADVLRIIDGPLAAVKGENPESVKYQGSAAHLQEVWIAARVAIRDILEEVSLYQIATNKLPVRITKTLDKPGAWKRR
ncbi:MAG TPA: Rrf2 family transcriptional regulator [Candidatus Nanopelagicaceae bacterium]